MSWDKWLQEHPERVATGGISTLKDPSHREKAMRHVRSLEHKMQVSLFRSIRIHTGQYPQLAYCHAIPNGPRLARGTAKKMKAEGLRAGVPDVMLPWPSGIYNGLYLELKIQPNRPGPKQLDFIQYLNLAGYYATVVYDDWYAAWELIEHYINNPESLPQWTI